MGNTPPQLKTNQISERLATFKLIYNCACELFKGMMYEAPFEVDSETHGAHLLMASEVHKELQLVEKSMPPIPTLYGEKKPTGRRSRKVSDSPEVFGDFSISESHLSENFYHRVDVVETGLTMIPLERFSKRVFELRELFPENLVLAQISKVIERIISFPLKSQVSKILAGLDLLLLKAQAWESVSPKMHSLAGKYLQSLRRFDINRTHVRNHIYHRSLAQTRIRTLAVTTSYERRGLRNESEEVVVLLVQSSPFERRQEVCVV